MLNRIVIFADQAIAALLILSFTVWGAQILSPADLGTFLLFSTAMTLIVGLTRAVSSEPLLFRKNSDLPIDGFIAAGSRVLSIAIGLGAIGIVAGFLGVSQLALLGLACIPVFHDLVRYRFLADTAGLALMLDLASLFLMTGIGVSLMREDVRASPVTVFLLLLVSYVPGALLIVPSLSAATKNLGSAWSVEHLRYGGDYTLGTASLQSYLYTAVYVAGTEAATALRGSDTLLGPLRVLLQAAIAVIAPTMASVVISPQRLRNLLLLGFVSAGSASAVLATALYCTALGTLLLADSWVVVTDVLPIVFASFPLIAVTNLSSLALKVKRRGDLLLKCRFFILPIGLSLGVVGAVGWQAQGAAMGAAVTSLLASFLWAWTAINAVEGKTSR